jgi:ABC-type molybdate transport system substrate-binding protein
LLLRAGSWIASLTRTSLTTTDPDRTARLRGDTVKAKTKLSKDLASGQAQIANGEIDLGLFNLSEIPRAPGVARAGPVPAAVQVYINYDSAISVTNTNPEPVLALLKYFQRPASRLVWDKAGLEIIGE